MRSLRPIWHARLRSGSSQSEPATWQPDFRLTAANGLVVMAICRRLDALPLALELAAPWIKVLDAEGLLHRLDQGVMTFATGSRDLPERQQTMNATVAIACSSPSISKHSVVSDHSRGGFRSKLPRQSSRMTTLRKRGVRPMQ